MLDQTFAREVGGSSRLLPRWRNLCGITHSRTLDEDDDNFSTRVRRAVPLRRSKREKGEKKEKKGRKERSFSGGPGGNDGEE